jgi:sugar phosphate isomerase/epimerase
MQLGLKLGSTNKNYTSDVLSLYENDYFQYIELFAIPGTFDDTIDYWKQFSIPIGIHAPHSDAGMNLSLKDNRKENDKKLHETFLFADSLHSDFIIFHSGIEGTIEETAHQLKSYVDSRCLIENKPAIGIITKKMIGSTQKELEFILSELHIGLCLDFGHAICAANSLKQEPMIFINELLQLHPAMYHLTDGDYTSEYDSHLHYGRGTFPIKELLQLVSDNAKLTNEAKHDSLSDLEDFKADAVFLNKETSRGYK